MFYKLIKFYLYLKEILLLTIPKIWLLEYPVKLLESSSTLKLLLMYENQVLDAQWWNHYHTASSVFSMGLVGKNMLKQSFEIWGSRKIFCWS